MSEIKVNKLSPRTNCGTVTVGDAGDSVTVTAGVPVTVNGDLKSNALKAVDGGSIISQCGTNITLGASGDTVSLASGASQSGFGRAGSVDWQTGDIKTATFTAADGEGYFCNTTSSAFTVNLPAGSSGAIVAINDYAQTAATNNITISANGSEKIEGDTANKLITTNGTSTTLVYVDATQGWKVVDTGEISSVPTEPLFTIATGGTITCCGDYKIHTFTGPGTFCVSTLGNGPTNPSGGPATVSYMVVAGGGSGSGTETGGGGGAGGFREGRDIGPSYTASPLVAPSGLTITATCFPITVGAGGPGPANGASGNGSNSVFSTIISAGGGGGANSTAGTGGSGGGGGRNTPGAGGSGNTPPTSPPQGNSGGNRHPFPFVNENPNTGGGGGGAGSSGTSGSSPTGGPGGSGVTTSITSSPTTYAGGGGGGGESASGGSGGSGGGAAGLSGGDGATGNAGTANTGGGGGGTGWGPSAPAAGGGAGGSGIVVIRYKFQ